MKRIACFILLIISFSSKAQNISLGPTAGFGHSWITNYGDSKFNPAWNVGLSFIYSSQSKFGFGADVKYSAEGIKNTYLVEGPAGGLVAATNILNANYIRVPVKLIYFFGKYGSKIRPKIYVGPDFGFFAGGESLFKDGDVRYKTSDFIKSFDVGGIVSAGLNFKLSSSVWLNTDIAYYNGFTDVSKDVTKSYNRNIQLNAGLLVGLRKK